mmetsp:Transcript_50601/g.134697  ORF Transcript_50601/g.134697 Transcript_50601/m.134697 type:complete len:207 (-) Transcript_50601:366-986(-)
MRTRAVASVAGGRGGITRKLLTEPQASKSLVTDAVVEAAGRPLTYKLSDGGAVREPWYLTSNPATAGGGRPTAPRALPTPARGTERAPTTAPAARLTGPTLLEATRTAAVGGVTTAGPVDWALAFRGGSAKRTSRGRPVLAGMGAPAPSSASMASPASCCELMRTSAVESVAGGLGGMTRTDPTCPYSSKIARTSSWEITAGRPLT